MFDAKAVFAALAITAATAGAACAAAATHSCDPATEEGWSVVPENQTLSETDGAPYQAGPAGSWWVERETIVLPFCDYFNAIGLYSLNSYSLSPVTTKERVAICRPVEGRSIAVPPYAGPCPPK